MSKQLLNDALNKVNGPKKCITKPPVSYPAPTAEDLRSPEFKAVMGVIKSWDIGVPEWYDGHTGAMGNHAMAILNALKKV